MTGPGSSAADPESLEIYSSSAVQAFSNLSSTVSAVRRAMDDFTREAANLSKYVQGKPALQPVDTQAAPHIHEAMVLDTWVRTIGAAFARADGHIHQGGPVTVGNDTLAGLITKVERQEGIDLAKLYHSKDHPGISPYMMQQLSLHPHEPAFAAGFLNTLQGDKTSGPLSPLQEFLRYNKEKALVGQTVADGYAGGLDKATDHTIKYFLIVPAAGTDNAVRHAILMDIAAEKDAAVNFTKFLIPEKDKENLDKYKYAINGLVTGAGGTTKDFFNVLRTAAGAMAEKDLRALLGTMGTKGAMPDLSARQLEATRRELSGFLETASTRLAGFIKDPVGSEDWVTALGVNLRLFNPLYKWVQTTAESDNQADEHFHALVVTVGLALGSTLVPEAATAALGEQAWEALNAGGTLEVERFLNKNVLNHVWPEPTDAEGKATDFRAQLTSYTMYLAAKAMYEKNLVTNGEKGPVQHWWEVPYHDNYLKFMQENSKDHGEIDFSLSPFMRDHYVNRKYQLKTLLSDLQTASEEPGRIIPGAK